jgi:predicted nuclease of predicted toxin-antitoxin system
MRILLDECVNQRLRNYLREHECKSARYAGLGGLKNGELLAAAEAAGFEFLVTVDRGFGYEQNLTGRKIAVIIFATKSIALKDLVPQHPRVPGSFVDAQARQRRDGPSKSSLAVPLIRSSPTKPEWCKVSSTCTTFGPYH